MLVQIGLILVAYYMGRKGIDVDTLVMLTKALLGKDEEEQPLTALSRAGLPGEIWAGPLSFDDK